MTDQADDDPYARYYRPEPPYRQSGQQQAYGQPFQPSSVPGQPTSAWSPYDWYQGQPPYRQPIQPEPPSNGPYPGQLPHDGKHPQAPYTGYQQPLPGYGPRRQPPGPLPGGQQHWRDESSHRTAPVGDAQPMAVARRWWHGQPRAIQQMLTAGALAVLAAFILPRQGWFLNWRDNLSGGQLDLVQTHDFCSNTLIRTVTTAGSQQAHDCTQASDWMTFFNLLMIGGIALLTFTGLRIWQRHRAATSRR